MACQHGITLPPRIFVDYNNAVRETFGERGPCFVALVARGDGPTHLRPGDKFIADNLGDGVDDMVVTIHETHRTERSVAYLFRDGDMRPLITAGGNRFVGCCPPDGGADV